MNSFSKISIALFSAFVGLSAAACKGKEAPSESAAKAEKPTAAPATPAAQGTSGIAAATRSSVPAVKLSDAECKKVVDHVLDISAKEALDEDSAKLSASEKKKQLAALRAELGNDPEFKKQAENCDDEYTKTEYTCMMAATTGEALDKCNESPN
jgi:hypothetical protein